MNLLDSSFLCLDIGVACVRGIAHRVRSGRIDNSATYSVCNSDTVFALNTVIDELEQKMGCHFDCAYITGNFGESVFEISRQETSWPGGHKITASDIREQISQLYAPTDFYISHIIPLHYDCSEARGLKTPIGQTALQLISTFGVISNPISRQTEIMSFLRRAHIQPIAFLDSQFLQYSSQPSITGPIMFIDMGSAFTTVSIWSDFGPLYYKKLRFGGADITREIANTMEISFDDAERIKHNVASMMPAEMDRFTPADASYDFSRAEINDIIRPFISNLSNQITEIIEGLPQNYRPMKIILSGGGSDIDNITSFLENTIGISIDNVGPDANVQSLSNYIWSNEAPRREIYIARQARFQRIFQRLMEIFHRPRKPKKRFIPILPSTLCFDMRNPDTYSLFKSGDISIIHVDIMDGLYVDKIAGGIPELKYIRAHTNAHLHVHLMTTSPTIWAQDAISAGANTVILSTNTAGLRDAIKQVRASGRRVGIAVNPDQPISIIKTVLRDIDEVMIMSVIPGSAGQEFDNRALKKISILAATRKKYHLKFVISVDGGINSDTAQLCWSAGADLLVSGSYLANSSDFPLAVQSLLKK